MIDLNQLVETSWNITTREWYESKGYTFTKYRDKFLVKAFNLPSGSTIKVKVKCDYCGKEKSIPYSKYLQSTKNYPYKYACSECGTEKMNDTYFEKIRYDQFEKFLFVCKERGHIPISTLSDYKNAFSIVKVICPIHGEISIEYNSYMNSKTGCEKCGHILTSQTLATSKEEVKKIVEGKNNNILLNPEDYVNIYTKNLKVVCGSCGKPFITSLSSIEHSGGRCESCGHEYEKELIRLPIEEVKKRIESVNGNKLLNPEQYVGNGESNLEILCSCGRTFTTSLSNYEYSNVNRCQICSKRVSKSELYVASILEKYKINYISEHKFEDCADKKPLPFDFYLTDYNCCVEFDGIHHYKPIYGEDRFAITKAHDEMKDNYCNNNGIQLIRIPYYLEDKSEEIITKALDIPKIKLIQYPLK